MAETVVDRLPTVEDVEREIARHRREALLLRTIRDALRRRQLQEKASEHFRRQNDSGVAHVG